MSVRLRACVALAALLLAAFSAAGPLLHAQQPVLTKVGIIVRTHGDDKDHNTAVQAWTTVPGGRFAITTSTFSCGNDSCRFPNHTDRHIELRPDAPYVKGLFARGFTTHMVITTDGDDSWVFTPTTVLTFSDGSTQLTQGAAAELNEGRTYRAY